MEKHIMENLRDLLDEFSENTTNHSKFEKIRQAKEVVTDELRRLFN